MPIKGGCFAIKDCLERSVEHPTRRFRPLTRHEYCKQVIRQIPGRDTRQTITINDQTSKQIQSTYSFFLTTITSRSYSPYRTPKPFVLYSSTRCTISIDITRSSAPQNKQKSIEIDWKIDRLHSFFDVRPQVRPQVRPRSRSDRTVSKSKTPDLNCALDWHYFID